MNQLLLAAGVLSIVVGLIHSVLGEVLIFKNLRDGAIIPTIAPKPLRERNLRILWATWHLASIFGWAIGLILIMLAGSDLADATTIVKIISFSMLTAGTLVLIATKARHPGWLGLYAVAVLCWSALP